MVTEKIMKNRPLPLQVSEVANPIYTLKTAAGILECNERILAGKFRKGEIQAKKKMGKWFTCHSYLIDYLFN